MSGVLASDFSTADVSLCSRPACASRVSAETFSASEISRITRTDGWCRPRSIWLRYGLDSLVRSASCRSERLASLRLLRMKAPSACIWESHDSCIGIFSVPEVDAKAGCQQAARLSGLLAAQGRLAACLERLLLGGARPARARAGGFASSGGLAGALARSCLGRGRLCRASLRGAGFRRTGLRGSRLRGPRLSWPSGPLGRACLGRSCLSRGGSLRHGLSLSRCNLISGRHGDKRHRALLPWLPGILKRTDNLGKPGDAIADKRARGVEGLAG